MVIEPEIAEPGTSLWSDARHRLFKNKLAVFGGITVLLIALVCVLGPLIIPYRESDQNLQIAAQAPSAAHWMGTDNLGRDLFVRVLKGGQVSMLVGLCATAVSLTIGVLYGTISGYFGGKLDAVMMRFVEIMYAMPFAIFVVLLMVFFGKNFVLLFVAIGAVEWLTMARIIRGQVLGLRQQEFIEAAIALGIPKHRIIFRHLIPNVMGTVIVYATLTIPSVMLLEGVLSFLGLGIQPPRSSWGVLIQEGASAIEEYPWQLAFPAIFFSLTLFSLNFFGDGLRDALDPRASKD
ncbi:MAG: ABC transporter permease subunit [Chthoniobacterales bacterium]